MSRSTSSVSGTESGGDRETGLLEADAVFETLSNRRRRHLLHYLVGLADGETTTVGTLSEQLAAWENDVDLSAVTSRQRKRLYTALHQTHLPKLDRLGIVEYDSARGTVAPGSEMAAFDVYFDMVAPGDVPWNQFYLGFAFLAVLAVTAGTAGLPPFGLLDGYGWALLVAIGLLVVAAFHFVYSLQCRSAVEGTPPRR